MFITELLAVLSIGAATGLRLAMPLLLIGLLSGEQLWSNVPLLAHLPPQLVIGILAAWSLAELVLSKDRPSQRLFQLTELVLSPVVGLLAGIAVARTAALQGWLLVLVAGVATLLALVIHLVQLGWFYRPQPPRLWVLVAEDFLCIGLVFSAFDAPQHGGIIALLLLWLVIRTSTAWRQWYGRPLQRSQRRRKRLRPQD
ncbi:DUF4126 domain-containing protein [Halomicronema hongdechloris]|uniref:DUF4126 domain-containing protein n=1 Tax=Halomicronema hongdechloris TaxID=1209493 RepID=UPI001650E2AA|nr:DUF4126 domain-containing protein [Halomicronema hongdechloris]